MQKKKSKKSFFTALPPAGISVKKETKKILFSLTSRQRETRY
jgi:hypothetical protein